MTPCKNLPKFVSSKEPLSSATSTSTRSQKTCSPSSANTATLSRTRTFTASSREGRERCAPQAQLASLGSPMMVELRCRARRVVTSPESPTASQRQRSRSDPSVKVPKTVTLMTMQIKTCHHLSAIQIRFAKTQSSKKAFGRGR